MTKEQWLENMLSEAPDYNGLLDEVSMPKDRDLLKYLIDELSPQREAMIKFIENVIDSDKLDWLLPEEDVKAIEEFAEEVNQYRLNESDEFIAKSTSSSSTDTYYTYETNDGNTYSIIVAKDGTTKVSQEK